MVMGLAVRLQAAPRGRGAGADDSAGGRGGRRHRAARRPSFRPRPARDGGGGGPSPRAAGRPHLPPRRVVACMRRVAQVLRGPRATGRGARRTSAKSSVRHLGEHSGVSRLAARGARFRGDSRLPWMPFTSQVRNRADCIQGGRPGTSIPPPRRRAHVEPPPCYAPARRHWKFRHVSRDLRRHRRRDRSRRRHPTRPVCDAPRHRGTAPRHRRLARTNGAARRFVRGVHAPIDCRIVSRSTAVGRFRSPATAAFRLDQAGQGSTREAGDAGRLLRR